MEKRPRTETPGPGNGWGLQSPPRGRGAAVPPAPRERGARGSGGDRPDSSGVLLPGPPAWSSVGFLIGNMVSLGAADGDAHGLPPWEVHCLPSRTVWKRTTATSREDALRYDFILTYGENGSDNGITGLLFDSSKM